MSYQQTRSTFLSPISWSLVKYAFHLNVKALHSSFFEFSITPKSDEDDKSPDRQRNISLHSQSLTVRRKRRLHSNRGDKKGEETIGKDGWKNEWGTKQIRFIKGWKEYKAWMVVEVKIMKEHSRIYICSKWNLNGFQHPGINTLPNVIILMFFPKELPHAHTHTSSNYPHHTLIHSPVLGGRWSQFGAWSCPVCTGP